MRIFKNQRGQALVEFAIILPILLLLVMGIAQFGMMFNSYLSLQNASRDGARAGAVGNSTAEIQNLILTTSPRLEAGRLLITVTPLDADRKPGNTLTVKLSYNYKLTVPIISNIFNNSVKLSAQTSMRIE